MRESLADSDSQHVIRWVSTLSRWVSNLSGFVGVQTSGHPGATKLVGQLIRDAGFDPVYVGDLSRAKDFDFGSKVYVRLLTAAQLRAELALK